MTRPISRRLAAATVTTGVLLGMGGFASAQQTAPGGLDHFKCYATSKPPFTQRTAAVKDHFASATTQVVSVEALCNPVEADAARIRRPLAHLTCYSTADADQNIKPRRVQVSNRFGTRQLAVLRPVALCVPSLLRKVPGSPPTKPNPATLVDHFRCYAVGPLATPRSVVLRDEFTRTSSRTLQAVRFCTPVSQDGSRVRRPKAHLVCYSIKDARGFRQVSVRLRDRFALSSVRARAPQTLCLPSLKQTITSP